MVLARLVRLQTLQTAPTVAMVAQRWLVPLADWCFAKAEAAAKAETTLHRPLLVLVEAEGPMETVNLVVALAGLLSLLETQSRSITPEYLPVLAVLAEASAQ